MGPEADYAHLLEDITHHYCKTNSFIPMNFSIKFYYFKMGCSTTNIQGRHAGFIQFSIIYFCYGYFRLFIGNAIHE